MPLGHPDLASQPSRHGPAFARHADLLDRFEDAWLSNDPLDIEALVSSVDSADRLPLLVELVQIDLERRLAAGQAVTATSYFARFPALAADLEAAAELISAESRLLPLVADSENQVPNAAENFGALLDGRYELKETIGEGGMGTVRRARDRRFDRDVAIKLLKPGTPAESTAATRFRIEAKITGQLQHPGIPPVYELSQLIDGRPFMTMKLVKGRTLRELLKERTGVDEDLGRLIAIFEQLCHTVGYAHAHRLIHRDLKPSNVMVGAHGEVQVMDWGLAKRLDDVSSEATIAADPNETLELETEIGTSPPEGPETQTGSVLGTPAYMPPEQAAGEVRKLNARSDVFGLGAILCEILTGRAPYPGPDAQALRLQAIRGETGEALARLDVCQADAGLVALCRRCLATAPGDRPEDARAVAAEVAALRQGAEARARLAEVDGERAVVRAAELAKRRRLILVMVGVVAMEVVLGAVAITIDLVRAAELEYTAKLVATIAAYEKAGDYEKAEFWQRKWLDHVKEKVGAHSPAYRGELAGLGLLLLKQQKWTDAEPVFRECLNIREETQGDHWTTFSTMSALGEALAGQHRFSEAEPLLLKGYEGMKTREQTIPKSGTTRLTEGLDRLIRFYEALDKQDEAEKWRKELKAWRRD